MGYPDSPPVALARGAANTPAKYEDWHDLDHVQPMQTFSFRLGGVIGGTANVEITGEVLDGKTKKVLFTCTQERRSGRRAAASSALAGAATTTLTPGLVNRSAKQIGNDVGRALKAFEPDGSKARPLAGQSRKSQFGSAMNTDADAGIARVRAGVTAEPFLARASAQAAVNPIEVLFEGLGLRVNRGFSLGGERPVDFCGEPAIGS